MPVSIYMFGTTSSQKKSLQFWCTLLPVKRYRKKPRQDLVSSSLDSLGLSAAVAHVFVCRLLMDSWGKGVWRCVYYTVDFIGGQTCSMDMQQRHAAWTCGMDM